MRSQKPMFHRKTYTVRVPSSEAIACFPNTAVTVPAELVSVRVTTDIEPLVANSVLILVVVYVRLLSVLMTTCTVPMVVGVIYWLQVKLHAAIIGPVIDEVLVTTAEEVLGLALVGSVTVKNLVIVDEMVVDKVVVVESFESRQMISTRHKTIKRHGHIQCAPKTASKSRLATTSKDIVFMIGDIW